MDASIKLSFMLHEMVCYMDAIADTHLKTHYNISFKKFFVLAVLYSCQPTTQARLAEHLGYSPAAVSRSLAILENDGYVQILDDPKHGRRNRVTLTIKGSNLVESAAEEMDALFHQALQDTDVDIGAFTKDVLNIRTKLLIENNKEK